MAATKIQLERAMAAAQRESRSDDPDAAQTPTQIRELVTDETDNVECAQHLGKETPTDPHHAAAGKGARKNIDPPAPTPKSTFPAEDFVAIPGEEILLYLRPQS